LLERTTALTPTELLYLEQIENRHKLDWVPRNYFYLWEH
jgi:hypothetical protein